MELLLMNLFSSVSVISAYMVISARNAVYSVFYLVMVFLNVAGLLLLLEVEFIGMILIVVYVGAVAVFFMFVIMMIAPRGEVGKISDIRLGLGLSLLVLMLINIDYYAIEGSKSSEIGLVSGLDRVSNIEVMGQSLYTEYSYNLLVAGFVLLVGLMGAIVLTREDDK